MFRCFSYTQKDILKLYLFRTKIENLGKYHYQNIHIQGVSQRRVLILTGGRTHQFMKLFSITFCKIHKSFSRSLSPNSYQTSRFV
jgi:hypothetical protein